MHKYFAKTQFLGKKVTFLSQCHSTNTEAANYVKANPDFREGTTFITNEQTAGKGQRGNTWFSEPGANATFSFLLKPTFIKAVDSFNLNLIISLGIYNALKNLLPDGLSIKWPNDIYYKNDKLGGLLIENGIQKNEIASSVVGIGININQTSFSNFKATSIKNILKKGFEPNEVIELILKNIEQIYASAKLNGTKTIKSKYLNAMFKIHESAVFSNNKIEFEGTIQGINAQGQLLILSQGVQKAYNIQEVKFIR